MFACCCSEEGGLYAGQVLQIPTLDERNAPLATPRLLEPPAAKADTPKAKEYDSPKTDAAEARAPAAVPESRAAPAQTFKITLAKTPGRQKAPMGWRLDCVATSVLYIFEVSSDTSTPVWAYNATAPEDKRLQVGDYIKSVNGQTEVNMMTAAIEKDEELELIIQQPTILNYTVQKNGASLGLELKYWQAGTTLMIGAVNDGAVKRSGLNICPGDRIIAVSGALGSSEALLQKLRGPDPLVLTISRCS